MSKFIVIFLATLLSFSLVFTDAQAKRFGGGRSFGTQRSISSQSLSSPTAFGRAAAPAAAAKGNRWAGPLMGLAAGGLLAYLFMGHGLAAGMMSWLLIAGILFFAWVVIRRLLGQHSLASHSQSSANSQKTSYSGVQGIPSAASPANDASAISYPKGFDPEDFLRNAKVQFLRLQGAYDAANLAELRELTTPEVFAELEKQIAERQGRPNITEVPHLEAKIVNIEDTPAGLLVSVAFSGMIRENPGEQASLFNEIWHFAKEAQVGRWLVTGVQQA